MRATPFLIVLLTICVSCAAPRYQIPQTEADLQATVASAEAAYQTLYTEHRAGQLSKPAMRRVDELYEAFRKTQEWLMNGVKAGAITFAKGD